MLRLDGGLTAVQEARVDAMLQAGRHLMQLINSVPDLSEIEAEHVKRQASAVDLEEIGQVCLTLVLPWARAKGLAVSLRMMPGAPRHVMADPARLRQLLLNLLGNAVKFTTAGSVELRVVGAVASGFWLGCNTRRPLC